MEIYVHSLRQAVKNACAVKKGMSLAQASLDIGWSKNALGQFLNGSNLSFYNLWKICRYFDLPLHSFVDETFLIWYEHGKHIWSDSSVSLNKRLFLSGVGPIRIYIDQPVTLTINHHTVKLRPGAWLVAEENDRPIDKTATYAVAKEDQGFELIDGALLLEKQESKGKYAYYYKIAGAIF